MSDLTAVTDPDVLARFSAGGPQEVSDPDVLARFNAGQQSPISTLGSAKAIGQGVREGAEGLAGMAGDIMSAGNPLLTRAGNYLFDKVFGAPTPEQAKARDEIQARVNGRASLPTTQDINDVTSAVVPNYTPQNAFEKHLANVSSFVPAALGGPESFVANVLKRGVLPGAVSDALGTAVQGTPLEAPARIVGAMAQPSARGAAIKELQSVLPNADELIQAGGAGSQAVRDLQYATNPAANKAWIDAATQDLGKRNLLQRAPVVSKLIGDAALQPYMKASDYDLLKLQLGDIKPGSADFTAAQEVLKRMDRHINSLSPNDALAGDPAVFKQTWNDAKANYAAGMRTQQINEAAQTAMNRTASQASGLNGGNNIRGELRKILDDTRGYNAVEEKALQDAVNGNWFQNLKREAANRLGGGGGFAGTVTARLLAGAGGYGAGEATGHPDAGLMLGIMGAGRAMRMSYNQMVKNTARDISLQLAMRSPLAQQRMAAAGITGMPTKGADWIRKLLQINQAVQNER